MIKVIVNATHKGGEGKTSMTVHLAEYLSLVLKKRVLAIDLDAQANLSGRYLPMEYDSAYKGGKIPPLYPDYDENADQGWDGRSSIANIFYGEEVLPYPTRIQSLDVLPAHSHKLQEVEMVSKHEVIDKVHVYIKKFVDIPEINDEYDIIIIDTPPSKGPLTIAAIKAASHLIIPAQMEQFSIEGIYGMLQLWKQETYSRAENNPLQLIGILPNRVRDIKLHKQFLENLREMGGVGKYVLPHVIKNRAIYTEILVEDAKPTSIFELPQNHIARIECERVCELITERIYEHGKEKII